MSDDREARVDDIGLVDVKDKVGILDQIDPESQRQAVGFPRVNHLRVRDPVLQGLIVQKVKHVLDGQRQGGPSVGDTEDGLEQVVHVLLQRNFGGEEPRQVNLRHHFIAPLVAIFAAVVVVVMADQMPHFDAGILIASAVVSPVVSASSATAAVAPVAVVVHGRRGPAHRRTGRTEFGQVEVERLVLVVMALVGGASSMLIR